MVTGTLVTPAGTELVPAGTVGTEPVPTGGMTEPELVNGKGGTTEELALAPGVVPGAVPVGTGTEPVPVGTEGAVPVGELATEDSLAMGVVSTLLKLLSV